MEACGCNINLLFLVILIWLIPSSHISPRHTIWVRAAPGRGLGTWGPGSGVEQILDPDTILITTMSLIFLSSSTSHPNSHVLMAVFIMGGRQYVNKIKSKFRTFRLGVSSTSTSRPTPCIRLNRGWDGSLDIFGIGVFAHLYLLNDTTSPVPGPGCVMCGLDPEWSSIALQRSLPRQQ